MKKRNLTRLLACALALLLILSAGGTAFADASDYVLARQSYESSNSLEYSYNEFGLATKLGLGYLGYGWEEFAPEDVMYIQVRYRYDDAGYPTWLRMDAIGEVDGFEVSIENRAGESQKDPIQVRLYDIRIFDGDTEESLDEDNLSTVWTFSISALRHASCYQTATFTMEGMENQLTLRGGRELYTATVTAYSKIEVLRELDSSLRVRLETTYRYSREGEKWELSSVARVRYDTRGRIVAVEGLDGSLNLTGHFQVRYTTVSNPNGGESIDFGTIVDASNEEQQSLSYTRYYFNADGDMTRAVQFTPFVGELAKNEQQATTWDYAPDGQLLRMERIRYSNGEIASHTLEEYITLWDALN